MRGTLVVCWASARWALVRNITNSALARLTILDPDSVFGLSVHRITLSALANTFGGIVRPICFAVLRLITKSNFIGCSTGRSGGLAPVKNLSTFAAGPPATERAVLPRPEGSLLSDVARG